MHCVKTTGLTHRYPTGDRVLQGINLEVPDGSIYGFLGPNGAGKTTTLRLVLGLLKRQQGEISLFGQDLGRHRIEILKRIGSLIESPSLYDHLTASENLRVLQKIHRCAAARINEVLQLVGLGDTAEKKVSQFSLGMKQRLSIAVSMLHRPKLLILDEPTNGLDPSGIIEIRDLLIRLNRQEGTSIIISSHLLAEIEKLVSHVGIIRQGGMMFQGTMEELRHRQSALLSIQTSNDQKSLALLAPQFSGIRLDAGRILLPAVEKEQIAAINRLLIEHGIEVFELRTTQQDLEAIFMDLVGT